MQPIIITRNFIGNTTRFWAFNTFETVFLENLFLEEPYLTALAKYCGKEDILYDIGAFIGTAGISLAHLVKQVFLFEPGPTELNELIKNVEINPEANVKVIPLAVGDQNGIVKLRTFAKSDKQCSSIYEEKPNSFPKLISVPIINIDTFAQSHPSPTVIKVDTEGNEEKILAGAVDTMSTIHTWGVEYHGWVYKSEHISAMMRGFGYTQVYKNPRSKGTLLTIWTRR